MTEREFAFVVNLFRSTVPEVNSRNVEAVSRNFKALCAAWRIQVNSARMTQLTNLLLNPSKLRTHRTHHKRSVSTSTLISRGIPVAQAGPAGLSLLDD